MAKPIKLPQWDTNLTNSVEPLSAKKTDGYATNEIPLSSNLNFLFAYIYLWLKWVDDGIWTAVSLTLSGALTVATFVAESIVVTKASGSAGVAGTFVGAAGIFAGANAGIGGTAVLGTGGQGGGDVGGIGGRFKGGASDGGGGSLGGYGAEVEGGLNADSTYRAALRATHGDIRLEDGNLVVAAANKITGVETVQVPTLINSWANEGGSASTAGYWRDITKTEVALQGQVKSGASGNAIFQLAAAYRPATNMKFTTVQGTGGTLTASDGASYIEVKTTGDVVPTFAGASGRTNISLDGIRFRI